MILGNRGPVILYHKAFEDGRLKELATDFPDLAPRIERVRKRLFDLLPVAREHYYHRDMNGSWSIKAVLPTIAPELDYSTLEEIQDGVAAQVGYAEAIESGTTAERKEQIRAHLLEYCKRDTWAMAALVYYFSGSGILFSKPLGKSAKNFK